MKLSKIAVCLATFACLGFSQLQASILIDFGGTSTSSGTPYWNGIGQLSNNGTRNLKNNTGAASPTYTLKYTGTTATKEAVSGLAALISTSLTHMTYAKSLWKKTYKSDVIDANLLTAIGGSSSSSGERTSTYTLGGLTAGHKYSLSLFVYSQVLSTEDAAELKFSGGTNVTMNNYKESAQTPTKGSGELSLFKGEQMITIEFTAGTKGNATLEFMTPKGSKDKINTTAIQALACVETNQTVPEPSTALLAVFGLGSLAMRRRRKA